MNPGYQHLRESTELLFLQRHSMSLYSPTFFQEALHRVVVVMVVALPAVAQNQDHMELVPHSRLRVYLIACHPLLQRASRRSGQQSSHRRSCQGSVPAKWKNQETLLKVALHEVQRERLAGSRHSHSRASYNTVPARSERQCLWEVLVLRLSV